MKKLILMSVFALALQFISKAQNSIAYYQVQDDNYIQCSEYTSNAELEFYSKPSGGYRMGAELVNSAGNLLQIYPTDNTPAFVIYRKSAQNVNGTNNVHFLKEKEFIAKDIQLAIAETHVNITWNAQVFEGNNIKFQIVKCNLTNSNEMVVDEMIGQVSNNMIAYNYQEEISANAIYKLKILKNNTLIRYVSESLGLASKGVISNKQEIQTEIKVYPTICNSNLSIELPLTDNEATYSICNLNGQIVQTGNLYSFNNTLNVQTLQASTYIIHVKQSAASKSFKFIKE
jgi:hypothetical protein